MLVALMPQSNRFRPNPYDVPWPRRRFLIPALAAVLALVLAVATPAQAPAPAPALGKADATRYLDTVRTLASPDMEGRGAGTKGIDRAAHLLAQRYQSLGLDPAGTQEIGRASCRERV